MKIIFTLLKNAGFVLLLSGSLFHCENIDADGSNDGNNNEETAGYNIEIPQFPTLLDVDMGYRYFSFDKDLVFTFNVLKGRVYNFIYDDSMFQDINFYFSHAFQYSDGTSIQTYGFHPRHYGYFIADRDDVVTVLLSTTVIPTSVAVKVDSYDLALVDTNIIANGQTHSFNTQRINQVSIPVVGGQLYRIENVRGGNTISAKYSDGTSSMIEQDTNYLGSSTFFIAQKTGDIILTFNQYLSLQYDMMDTFAVLPVNIWHDINAIQTQYYAVDLQQGFNYTITGGSVFIPYPGNILWTFVFPDGSSIRQTSTALMTGSHAPSFFAQQSGTGYFILETYVPGLIGVNIEERAVSQLTVNSGWKVYNVVEKTVLSFDAVQGETYTISWDDAGDGSGVYTSDVDVTVDYNDGTNIIDNQTDGYTISHQFNSAHTGKVNIVINPNINGTVGLNIASSTPAPITINNGWQITNVHAAYTSKYIKFNVTQGTIYSVKVDDNKDSATCASSGLYNGSTSTEAYYVGGVTKSYSNYIFSQVSCSYMFPSLFIASKTGEVLLRIFSYNGGSYAVRVDTVDPVPRVVDNIDHTINLNTSMAYKIDMSSSTAYSVNWKYAPYSPGFTSSARPRMYKTDGTEVPDFTGGTTARIRSLLPWANESYIILVHPPQTTADPVGTIGLQISEEAVPTIPVDSQSHNIDGSTKPNYYSFDVMAGGIYKIMCQGFGLGKKFFSDGTNFLELEHYFFIAPGNGKVYIQAIPHGGEFDPSNDSISITKY